MGSVPHRPHAPQALNPVARHQELLMRLVQLALTPLLTLSLCTAALALQCARPAAWPAGAWTRPAARAQSPEHWRLKPS